MCDSKGTAPTYEAFLAENQALKLEIQFLKEELSKLKRLIFGQKRERFVPSEDLSQLDLAGLGHNTFSDDAILLIVRSSDGILRKTRNLCIASLLEAVRQGKKNIDIDTINKVLIQPHWRVQNDLQAAML